MPTYEYKNLETGEIYEFKQSMRDDALTHHPETGAAIKRLVSVPGIAFKGSGFYANDSRAAGRSAPKSGGEAAGGAPDASAGSTEKSGGEAAASSTAGEGSAPAPAKAPEPPAPKPPTPKSAG